MRLHFAEQQAKRLHADPSGIASRNSHWMNRHTKPGVGWTSGKKISNHVTRNSERETTRDHGVDADQAATCVGKWAAGIARCQANIGLHP